MLSIARALEMRTPMKVARIVGSLATSAGLKAGAAVVGIGVVGTVDGEVAEEAAEVGVALPALLAGRMVERGRQTVSPTGMMLVGDFSAGEELLEFVEGDGAGGLVGGVGVVVFHGHGWRGCGAIRQG
jgi:hypothetical protein